MDTSLVMKMIAAVGSTRFGGCHLPYGVWSRTQHNRHRPCQTVRQEAALMSLSRQAKTCNAWIVCKDLHLELAFAVVLLRRAAARSLVAESFPVGSTVRREVSHVSMCQIMPASFA
ncbi:unnamed protein product [Ectocarpus sp. 12 AP-2014]